MTDEVLGKLREAFLFGCTDEEACLYANIHPSSLYDYLQEHVEFSEEREWLKQNQTVKARKAVDGALNAGNVNIATWLLERKRRSEFGQKVELETTTTHVLQIDEAQLDKALAKIEDELKKHLLPQPAVIIDQHETRMVES